MSKKQKLPKWFNGECYTRGGTVANRFTGEIYELNNVELSMYDFIMGATIISEMGLDTDIINLRKGTTPFPITNLPIIILTNIL